MHTVYDSELFEHVADWLFDPKELEQRGALEAQTSGRRSAYIFRVEGQRYVLRHFWRGGLVGRLLTDTYVWTGLRRSRPMREWQLLLELQRRGLPVPRPAAFRTVRHGAVYRADLITVELDRTRTLADLLAEGPLGADAWRGVGAIIAEFHRHGAYHHDLNARNILIDSTGSVYVIDWDRGCIRKPRLDWQQSNLTRLRRSLLKQASLTPTYNFGPRDFALLLAGYRLASYAATMTSSR